MEQRVKEMDGLRGIAVVLVIALHVFHRANEFTQHPTLHFITSFTSIGWVGVDIFFVLSGFLITSILLRARDRHDYFKNFYARRILRIAPLYYAAIIIVFLLIVPIKTPHYMKTAPKIIPVLLLYQQNWLSILHSIKQTPYIWVTWSLAIEEQFYLIWPAVVYFSKKDTLLKISIYTFLASTIGRILGVLFWDNPDESARFFYYNSFTRFDELIFGGILAIALTNINWREWINRVSFPVFLASFAGFLGLCIASLPGSPNPSHSNVILTAGGYTTATVFSAALIAIFMTRPENFFMRVLFRNKIIVFLGKYSYSMYLFHMPVALVLLDILWWTHRRGWKMYLLYIVLTFATTILASQITWYLLEKHMLNLKRYFAGK